MLVNSKTATTQETLVKFVSYDGRYPSLCFGTLVLEIDGKKVTFGEKGYGRFWESSGSVSLSSGSVTTGDWIIDIADLPDEYKKYAEEIDRVFNANVRHGCCGGCL